ncbi:hypothetical protein VP01_841g4 [Puccinia sorghi]|uniref:Uncharacterized protein n=1 Tax=Puccinia sorghi TaxID=27349 RepID=A0A0L6U9C6_9BASI|nr:hypothetical protein VP01_841g4 [Puccinia sorghi]
MNCLKSLINHLKKRQPKNTSKGKQRASNYQNINPKSQVTPKEAPNPFKSYREYASKRDECEHFEGKDQVARDGLTFEMLKFELQVKKQ